MSRETREPQHEKHADRKNQSVASKRIPTHYITIPTLFVVVVGIWEFIVPALGVQAYILPRPSAIAGELTSQLQEASFWDNVGVTVWETVMGYALGVVIAVVIGVFVSQSRLVERTLMPYVVGFQSLPLIAIAPLLVLWFGFGITSKIVMASTITFFPVLLNVIEGLRASKDAELDMAKVFGAHKIQQFLRIKIPNSLPFVFVGLDVGIILALLGAVVGEFVGAKAGIGFQLLQYNFNFDIAGVFAMLVVLAVIGIIAHLLVRFVRARVVFWS